MSSFLNPVRKRHLVVLIYAILMLAVRLCAHIEQRWKWLFTWDLIPGMQCSFSQQNSPPLHWRSLQSLDLSKIHPTGQNNCPRLLSAFSVPAAKTSVGKPLGKSRCLNLVRSLTSWTHSLSWDWNCSVIFRTSFVVAFCNSCQAELITKSVLPKRIWT